MCVVESDGAHEATFEALGLGAPPAIRWCGAGEGGVLQLMLSGGDGWASVRWVGGRLVRDAPPAGPGRPMPSDYAATCTVCAWAPGGGGLVLGTAASQLVWRTGGGAQLHWAAGRCVGAVGRLDGAGAGGLRSDRRWTGLVHRLAGCRRAFRAARGGGCAGCPGAVRPLRLVRAPPQAFLQAAGFPRVVLVPQPCPAPPAAVEMLLLDASGTKARRVPCGGDVGSGGAAGDGAGLGSPSSLATVLHAHIEAERAVLVEGRHRIGEMREVVRRATNLAMTWSAGASLEGCPGLFDSGALQRIEFEAAGAVAQAPPAVPAESGIMQVQPLELWAAAGTAVSARVRNGGGEPLLLQLILASGDDRAVLSRPRPSVQVPAGGTAVICAELTVMGPAARCTNVCTYQSPVNLHNHNIGRLHSRVRYRRRIFRAADPSRSAL